MSLVAPVAAGETPARDVGSGDAAQWPACAAAPPEPPADDEEEDRE